MTKKALALLVAVVIFASAAIALAGPSTSSAHQNHCPGQTSSTSHGFSEFQKWYMNKFKNDHHKHNVHYWWKWWKKHHKHHDKPCVTPAPRQGTPAPATTAPTDDPTPEPTPDPTPEPTPEPTPAPTPTPPPTPAPPTPAPETDAKVVGVTVMSPPNATAGQAFMVSAMVTLHNNGPAPNIIVDTTFNLVLPSGCVAPTNNVTVTIPGRNLPASTVVSTFRSWNIVCSTPGDRTFTVNVSTSIAAGQAWGEANPLNNGAFGTSMTAVAAAASPTPVP